MKQEYLIAFGESWYHFYISPEQGLCVNKKRGARFYFSQSLLKDATDDFCAILANECIHCVCQDKKGAIRHFLFDGEKWHSRTLLESREKSATKKNLTLIAKGSFVHLFYTISTKGRFMLVHQLLGNGAKDPQVADYISEPFFSVCPHTNGDITLLYKNPDGVLGTKRFRWSKKAFDAFFPLDCGCNLERAVLSAGEDDSLEICGYKTFDKFENILFVKKDALTKECTLSAVHLVSGISEGLALSRNESMLRISWCENGFLMTSVHTEAHRWSPPKKYIRGTTMENVLYHIESGAKPFSAYGYMQDGRITLYHARDILDLPPKRTNNAQAKTPPPENKPPEYVKRSVYLADMASVRKLLAGQNDATAKMLKKITALEDAMREKEALFQKITKIDAKDIAEDPEQIDRLAAENL